MESSNKDKSSQIEAQKQEEHNAEGPFTAGQMRALKMATAIMGVMIVICVILLGIGLSRQANKIASSDEAPVIMLDKQTQIKAISADGNSGIWLYTITDGVEAITYYKSSGKAAGGFDIQRH